MPFTKYDGIIYVGWCRWGEALSAPLRKARDITKQLLSAKESSNSDSKDASKDSSDQVDGTASEDADKDAAPPEEVVLLLVFAKYVGWLLTF